MKRPSLVVIGGPTATGKTEVALKVARLVGGELVGADSVQVYRGLDIGSSKPSADELQGIAHHLLDVINPDQEIDAKGYQELADVAIQGIAERGRVPIIVGGTGLWLRALLRGLVELPLPLPDLRLRLSEERDRLGDDAMHLRLREVDPPLAERLHPNDSVRVLRGLEVFEQTGQPLSLLQQQHALGALRYPVFYIALDRSAEVLSDRLSRRTHAMLKAGWLDEVKAVYAKYGDVRALRTVGYQEVLAYQKAGLTEGEGTSVDGVKTELARSIIQSTRTYSRRQRTWFASDPSVNFRVMLNTDDAVTGVAEWVARRFREKDL